MSDKPLHEKFDAVEYGIKFPLNNKHPLETFFSMLISTVSVMFVFPLFVVMGYLTRVRGSSLNGETNSPRFENYRELAMVGSRCFVAYLPLIFIIILALFLSLYFPFLIGLIGVPLGLWPIISLKFAEHEDYKRVYDGEILDILSTDLYVRFLSIYTFMLIVLLTATFIIGVLSVGIGALVLLPMVLWFRAAFWGYAGRKIRRKLERESNESNQD